MADNSKAKTLVAPSTSSIVGTVVKKSFREEDKSRGGVFTHDTHIITLAVLGERTTKEIFITQKQWEKYGCADIFYKGNIANCEIEHCVEGVTGYPDVEGKMVAHGQTFDSFVNSTDADDVFIMMELSMLGVSDGIVANITRNLTTVRAKHEDSKNRVLQPVAEPVLE